MMRSCASQTLLTLLLALSGCGGTGAEGQAVPQAGALEHLQRPEHLQHRPGRAGRRLSCPNPTS